jgi:hypothetical protein
MRKEGAVVPSQRREENAVEGVLYVSTATLAHEAVDQFGAQSEDRA